MNEEFLKGLWNATGGEKVGSFDAFVNELKGNKEFQTALWQYSGGDKIGSEQQFLDELGIFNEVPPPPPPPTPAKKAGPAEKTSYAGTTIDFATGEVVTKPQEYLDYTKTKLIPKKQEEPAQQAKPSGPTGAASGFSWNAPTGTKIKEVTPVSPSQYATTQTPQDVSVPSPEYIPPGTQFVPEKPSKVESLITQYFGEEGVGFISAIKRGLNSGELADLLALGQTPTKEDMRRIAELQRENLQNKPSKAYEDFINSEGTDAISNFIKNPFEILTQLTTETLVAQVRHGYSRAMAGAAMGAGVGATALGAGAIPGAGFGFAAGMGLAGLNLEVSSSILESLQEAGIDVTDEESLRQGFSDENMMSKAREFAFKRGVPIAIFDALSAGIAGKFLTKPAASLVGKVAKGVTEMGVQSGLAAAGETAAQISSGQKINTTAILAEALGELGGGLPEIAVGTAIQAKKAGKKVKDILFNVNLPKENFEDMVDISEGAGQITAQQADEIKAEYDELQSAKEKLPNDYKQNKAIFDLIEERDTLTKDMAKSDPAFTQDYKERIDAVNQRIQEEITKQKQAPKTTEVAATKKAYDFDDTLYNNTTGKLTVLGEEVKKRIEAGEDVTIVTARTPEQTQQIKDVLGIAEDKIEATGDEKLKKEALDKRGIDTKDYYDVDTKKMGAVQEVALSSAPDAGAAKLAGELQTSIERADEIEKIDKRAKRIQALLDEDAALIEEGDTPLYTPEQKGKFQKELEDLKTRKDAIQNQSTTAVPVQPGAQGGPGVGGQVQAKPEGPAGKGKVQGKQQVQGKEQAQGEEVTPTPAAKEIKPTDIKTIDNFSITDSKGNQQQPASFKRDSKGGWVKVLPSGKTTPIKGKAVEQLNAEADRLATAQTTTAPAASTKSEYKTPMAEKDSATKVNRTKYQLQEDVPIFKGTKGKRNIDGTFRTAHPDVVGSFASTDKKIAERYKGEGELISITLPAGTTVETVNIDLKAPGRTLSQYRADETQAINDSTADVVKLVTMDARGVETQYIIKNQKLRDELRKQGDIEEKELAKYKEDLAKQTGGVSPSPTPAAETKIEPITKTALEQIGKTKKQIVDQIYKFFTSKIPGLSEVQAKEFAEVNYNMWKAVADTLGGNKGLEYIRQKVSLIGTISTEKEARDFAKAEKGGIKFQIIGEKGAAALDAAEESTIRLDNLQVARDMEAEGKDAKAIRLATGWEKGKDGKWKYEIPDIELTDLFEKVIDNPSILATDFKDGIPLEKVVKNKELFSMYPQLSNIKLRFYMSNDGSKGSYSSVDKKLFLNLFTGGGNLSTFSHEIQHAIQDIEGFAGGGSLSNTLPYEEVLKKEQANQQKFLNDQITKFKNEISSNKESIKNLDKTRDAELIRFLNKEISNNEDLIKSHEYVLSSIKSGSFTKAEIFDAYRRLAGEVEARNVQTRMNMSSEQRRQTLLEETEDVARKDQIVILDSFDNLSKSLSKGDVRFDTPSSQAAPEQLQEVAERIVNNAIDHLQDIVKKQMQGLKKESNPARRKEIQQSIKTNQDTISKLQKARKDPRFQADVYHGSPYVFDKFSLDNIGTGEGAQAFGWGLYFTELKNIAEFYAEKLSNQPRPLTKEEIDSLSYNGDNIWKALKYIVEDSKSLPLIKKALYNYGYGIFNYTSVKNALSDNEIYYAFNRKKLNLNNLPEDIDNILENKDNLNLYEIKDKLLELGYAVSVNDVLGEITSAYKIDLPSNLDVIKNDVNTVLEFFENNKDSIFEDKRTPKGALYKATLHKGKTPDQYTWLEWDKTVSSDIIDRLNEKLVKPNGYNLKDAIGSLSLSNATKKVTGKELYEKIENFLGSDKQASLFLLENGIDGIKYPAESISRGATTDTARGFNYVVFDENVVTIEDRIQFQQEAAQFRGATIALANGSSVVASLSSPSPTTLPHEGIFHAIIEDAMTPEEQTAFIEEYNREFGDNATEWNTDVSEYTARTYEKYLSNGRKLTAAEVPNAKRRNILQQAFDKFTELVKEFYNGIIEYNNSKGVTKQIEVSPQAQAFFDRVTGIATPSQAQAAPQVTEATAQAEAEAEQQAAEKKMEPKDPVQKLAQELVLNPESASEVSEQDAVSILNYLESLGLNVGAVKRKC